MPVTTTDETWAVNGIILNKLAYNFSGLGGRLDGPSIRGANQPSPLGADRNRLHWYGPRDESWEMWVSEHDPATDLPGGRAQASANLDALKALFEGNVNVPLAVTRVIRLPSGLTTRTTEAYAKQIVVQPNLGAAFSRVVVKVEIPSGLWIGDADTVTTAVNATVTVAGTASVIPKLITLSGNVDVQNTTTQTGFAYSGVGVQIDPNTWQSVPANAISGLKPVAAQLLVLAPGPNFFVVTGGSVQVDWEAGFL